MKRNNHIDCDMLVIGAGMAGFIAAARASTLGLKTIQAGNSSALFLASGLFDLLGVQKTGDRPLFAQHHNNLGNSGLKNGEQPLTSPLGKENQGLTPIKKPYAGIQQLQLDQPDHPYAKADANQISESVTFLHDFLTAAGLSYRLPGTDNCQVLTSVGTLKPTYMVPQTVSKGCNLDEKNLLIVDFKGLRGFSARQAAAGIGTKKEKPHTLRIELPESSAGLNPVHLATSFEEKEFIQQLADKIRRSAGKADIVGLPAICGIHNSLERVTLLEHAIGRDVFEIPGMPPSIPGLRLKNAFEKKCSDLNTCFLSNARMVFHAMEKDRFILKAVNHNFETRIKAKGVILATGRFPGGGLLARREKIVETVFNLPVFQPESREMWHRLNFFDPRGHLINQAGVETDNWFRPLDRTGKPAFENLYAAGSIIAHNDWPRLKCGTGVSLLSAYTAVNHFHAKQMRTG